MTMSDDQRAPSGLGGLEDFNAGQGSDSVDAPRVPHAALEAVAERSGFTSRQPGRRRSKQTFQLNIKMRPDVGERFIMASEELDAVYGALFEEMLDAWEEKQQRLQAERAEAA